MRETPSCTHPLYAILRTLDSERVWYQLARTMDDSVLIIVTVVGIRVEIFVFADGTIWISRFHGDEAVEEGIEAFDRLIADFRADNQAAEHGLRAREPFSP